MIGYSVLKQDGQQAALYNEEREFELRLSDKLDRRWIIPITVHFDNSAPNEKPVLRIIGPYRFKDRLYDLRKALISFTRAFKPPR